MYNLSQKDLLELKFWYTADMEYQLNKMKEYLKVFGVTDETHFTDVLEIGCGPHLGLLPFLNSKIKVGIDPLIDAYQATGLLDREVAKNYSLFSVRYEDWDTAHKYNAIFCADALDHGEMGFQLVPKIAGMLASKGRFYLHVHLRPKDYINLIHDHQLTQEQLDIQLSSLNLIEVERKLYENDIDGQFCQALVGIWEKP